MYKKNITAHILRLSIFFNSLHVSYYFIFSCISHVEGMNEDGSFIGLYGKKRQGETTSAGFATLV